MNFHVQNVKISQKSSYNCFKVKLFISLSFEINEWHFWKNSRSKWFEPAEGSKRAKCHLFHCIPDHYQLSRLLLSTIASFYQTDLPSMMRSVLSGHISDFHINYFSFKYWATQLCLNDQRSSGKICTILPRILMRVCLKYGGY